MGLCKLGPATNQGVALGWHRAAPLGRSRGTIQTRSKAMPIPRIWQPSTSQNAKPPAFSFQVKHRSHTLRLK